MSVGQRRRWGGKQVGKARDILCGKESISERPLMSGTALCSGAGCLFHRGTQAGGGQGVGMVRGADNQPCSAGEVGLDLPRERVTFFYFPQMYLQVLRVNLPWDNPGCVDFRNKTEDLEQSHTLTL